MDTLKDKYGNLIEESYYNHRYLFTGIYYIHQKGSGWVAEYDGKMINLTSKNSRYLSKCDDQKHAAIIFEEESNISNMLRNKLEQFAEGTVCG